MNVVPAVAVAANMPALKDELIDVVSGFLLKEPPLAHEPPQALRVDAYASTTTTTTTGNTAEGTPQDSAPVTRSGAGTPSPTTTTTHARAQPVSPVDRIRVLVHLISQHDGEFVLKLALYVRHDLRIRNTANFLIALCAREPKCLPFLEGYMEKVVVLPSDWLAVASFAYYFDNDAAHQDAASHADRSPSPGGTRAADTRHVIPAALRRALVARFQSFTEFSLAKYSNEAALKRRKYKQKAKHRQAQRVAAKTRRQCVAVEDAVVSFSHLFDTRGSDANDSDDTGSEETRDDDDGSGSGTEVHTDDDEDPGATAPFIFARERTFTYKQLVRRLHMSTPSYLVCCLLGKRYPHTFEAFKAMKLDEPLPTSRGGADASSTPRCRVFDATQAGTRMRLLVPEIWETELARHGNTGVVWDRLFSRKAVPFMAMLRNLRNVLTRNVSDATHKYILSRLRAEEEVAASGQMPHRFLSAYYSVQGALADYYTTKAWKQENDLRAECARERLAEVGLKVDCQCGGGCTCHESRGRGRGRGRGVARRVRCNCTNPSASLSDCRGRGSGRGRGRGSGRGAVRGRGPLTPLRFPKVRDSRGVLHQCEPPLPSEEHMCTRVAQYEEALNEATMISLRLNVQPLPGSALVVLCIWHAMLKPLKAVGGGPVESLRTKLELAVLLAVMVKQCSEDGTVLVTCYDQVRTFHPPHFAEQSLMDNVMSLKTVCEEMLGAHAAKVRSPSQAVGMETRTRASSSTSCTTASRTTEGAAECDSHDDSRRDSETRDDDVRREGPISDGRAGATFPFFYLDEIIERRRPLESLVVIDEGHHTYGRMNADAPSLGDLPVYLHRLRHTCSPNLIFVAVSTSSETAPAGKATTPPPAPPPPTTGHPAVSSLGSGAVPPAQRYVHRNDVVLTGFSDAILRLIAERGRGGPRPYIERADEVFQIERFAGHKRDARRRVQQQRALEAIQKNEAAEKERRASRAEDVARRATIVESDEETLLGPSWPFTKRSAGTTITGTTDLSEEPGLTQGSYSHSITEGHARTTTTTSCTAAARSGSLGLLPDDGLTALTQRAEAALMGTGRSRAEAAANGGLGAPPTARGRRVTDDAGVAHFETFTSPVVYQPKPFIMVSKASSRGGAQGKRLLAHKMQNMAKTHASSSSAATFARPTPFSSSAPHTTRSLLQDRMPSDVTDARAEAEERHRVAIADTLGRETSGRVDGAAAYVPRPLTDFYECRFFISSTFLDMNNERNALTLDVFPRLRRWAADLGLRVNILEMDLRWGITEDATNAYLSTSVCLNNVSRCAPFFIGMLGDRYGSCPSPLSIVVDEDIPIEDYAWLETLPEDPADAAQVSIPNKSELGRSSTNSVSVTELEMRHGVYTSRRRLLPSAPPATVFFFRDSTALQQSLPKDERGAVYAPDAPTSPARIARLKTFLANEGVPVVAYTATFTDGTRTCGMGIGRADASATSPDGAIALSAMAGGADGGQRTHLQNAANVEYVMRHTWAHRSPSSIPSYLAFFRRPGDQRDATSNVNSRGARDFRAVVNNAAAAGGAQRYLTSQDVLLDMTDFTRKAFFALRAIIAQVCGVPLVGSPDGVKSEEKDGAMKKKREVEKGQDITPLDGCEANETQRREKKQLAAHATHLCPSSSSSQQLYRHLQTTVTRSDGGADTVTKSVVRCASPSASTALSVTENPRIHTPAAERDFFTNQQEALQLYMDDLCKVYVPPPQLLEQLAGFALQGTVPSALLDAADDVMLSSGGRGLYGTAPGPGGDVKAPSWRLTATQAGTEGSTDEADEQQQQQQTALAEQLGLEVTGQARSHVLIVTGNDGDGKSSALAALAKQLQAHETDTQAVVYYALQADGSTSMQLSSLVLCLARALVHHSGLYDEVELDESDSTNHLVQRFPEIYRAINTRTDMSVVVLLDAPEKCLDAETLLQYMGWIVNPGAAPAVRFIIATDTNSPFADAFSARVPPALVCSLPLLTLPDRADLVRRHLTLYGKVLQETMDVNELNALLHKRDASHPSYLTAAMLHLRLFSAFDTLRQDIRQLPTTIGSLYRQFFASLESQFDALTCRQVLTTLSLRDSAGGVMEHTLYRLVTNAAVVSGLVDLLSTTGLTSSRGGNLTLRNSFFATAITNTYCATTADSVAAREALILAELLYQPLRPATDVHGTRKLLHRVIESVRQSAVDPSSPRLFTASRYSAHELLSILHDAARAGRADVVLTLTGYLPFLERLLEEPSGAERSQTRRRSHSTRAGASASSRGSGGSTTQWLAQLVGLLVPLCEHRNTEVASTAQSLVHFFEQHYQTLLVRPSLLVQCVRNMSPTYKAISRYSTADYLNWKLQCRDGSLVSADNAGPDTTHSASTAVASPTGTAARGEAEHDELDRLLFQLRARRASRALAASTDTATLVLSPPARRTPTQRRSVTPHVYSGSTGADKDSHGDDEDDTQTGDVWVQWDNVSQHGAGMRLSSFRPAASQPVLCLAASPDGKEVALGFADGYARVAPLTAPDQLKAALKHVSAVTAISFLPSRPHTLVSGCEKGLLYVWSLEDNSLLQVGSAHLRCISAIAVHPTEAYVCTGSYDAHAMLWDLLGTVSTTHSLLNAVEDAAQRRLEATDDKQTTRTRTRRGPGGIPTNRFGAFVLGGDKRTRLQPFHVLRHHRAPISSVAFHRDGDVLATGAWDHTVFLVHLSDVVARHPGKTTAEGSRAEENNGETGGSNDDFTPRFASMKFTLNAPVRVVHFAPSMVVTCAVGTYSGAISLVDFASGLESSTLTHLHHAPISALSFSRDGKLLASADVRGQMRVSYAGVTGTVLCALNGHHDAITGLQFTSVRDRGILVSAGLDATVQQWRVEAAAHAEPATPTAHSAAVTCVCVAADGSVYVTGSADGTAFVFGRKNGDGDTLFTQRDRRAHRLGRRQRAGAVVDEAPTGGYDDERGAQDENVSGRRAAVNQREQRTAGEDDTENGEKGEANRNASDLSAAVYEPLMSLHHNGWRVTSIAFALSNTRIVTGVASGDVYVWSSQPGLSRREGRLLLRVPVPRQGIFPVIALEAADLALGVTVAVADATEAQKAVAHDLGRLTPSTSTSAPVTTSRVTALCSSGDTVHFNVYTSAVSLALQQQDDQQPPEAKLEAQAGPTSAVTAMQAYDTDVTSHPDASARRYDEDKVMSKHKSCERTVILHGDKDRGVNGSDSDESTSHTHVRLNAPRDIDVSAERVHYVQRQRLQWLRHTAEEVPDGRSVSAHPHAPATTRTGSAVPLTPSVGEELLAAISLSFRCGVQAWRGPQKDLTELLSTSIYGLMNNESEADPPLTMSRLASASCDVHTVCFGWAGTASQKTFLQVETHNVLVVGRQNFFLASFRYNSVSALEVRKVPSLVWRDHTFDTHLRLVEDETMVAVTDVCYVADAGRHVLCAVTNKGRLLFLCFATKPHRATQSAQDVLAFDENGGAETTLWLWYVTSLREQRTTITSASASLNNDVSNATTVEPLSDAQHDRNEEAADEDQYGQQFASASGSLLVDALTLSVSTRHQWLTTKGRTAFEIISDTPDTLGSAQTLDLIVACRDGSTRVLSLGIADVVTALKEVSDAMEGRHQTYANDAAFSSSAGRSLVSSQSPSLPLRAATSRASSPPPPPPSRATGGASIATPLTRSPPASPQMNLNTRRAGPAAGAASTLRRPPSTKPPDSERGDAVMSTLSHGTQRTTHRLKLVEKAVLYASAPLKALALLPRRPYEGSSSRLASQRQGTAWSGWEPLSWIVGDDVGNVYRVHLEDAHGGWATRVAQGLTPLRAPAGALVGTARTVATREGGPLRSAAEVSHARVSAAQSPEALMWQQSQSLAMRALLGAVNVDSSLARDLASVQRSEDVHMPRVPRVALSVHTGSQSRAGLFASASVCSPRGASAGKPSALYPEAHAALGNYTSTVNAVGLGTHTDLRPGGPLWSYLNLHQKSSDTSSSPWSARLTSSDFYMTTASLSSAALLTGDTTTSHPVPSTRGVVTRDEKEADAAPAAGENQGDAATSAASSECAESKPQNKGSQTVAGATVSFAQVVKPTADALTARLDALRREEENVTRLFLHPPRRRHPATTRENEACASEKSSPIATRQEEEREEAMGRTAATRHHTAEPAESVDDEDNYFSPLTLPQPPASARGSAEKMRKWYLRQQEVLKEALRVQKYNKEARAALKIYQSRATTALGL